MTSFNKKNYWQGPANILVPGYIDGVPCLDNVNTMLKNGTCTKLDGPSIKPFTVESYRKKFAEYKDGKWFWVIPEISDFAHRVDLDLTKLLNHQLGQNWKGPFDILIPNYISCAPGPNGEYHDRDYGPKFTKPGPITRRCEKAYKRKYAELNPKDNKWYWRTTLEKNNRYYT